MFCPKYELLNGKIKCPNFLDKLNPLSKYYTEGDAWHYRFDVTHDTPELIRMYGGNEQFVVYLNKFF